MDRRHILCLLYFLCSKNKLRGRMLRWSLRLFWCSFRWRRNSFLEAVGYDNASYGNSAERERNVEAGLGREN